MLHVSQDLVVEYYDERRIHGFRPTWSLDSKWKQIKHDMAKFIGVHQQCMNLNKLGSNAAVVLKHTKELYWIKSPKNSEFMFQHI
jgi:hypothetical protein